MPTIPLADVLTAEVHDPTWLVKDMLPRGQLTILAGEPGVGKSILCYHLALAVASGLPFLGVWPTVRTKVLYIDQENSWPDFARYVQWAWRGLGQPDVANIDIQLEHFSLLSDWRPTLERLATTIHPGLIIVDTATPAFSVMDENDNSEATRITQYLRRIQVIASNETTILILKHEREADGVRRRNIRGAKAWSGAVDSVMFHVRGRGRPRKDGLKPTFLEPDKVRAFGLRSKIKVIPEWATEARNGLILKGEVVDEP